MKIKNPRTCNGCAAMIEAQSEPMRCKLGFAEMSEENLIGCRVVTIRPPKDGCPKPKTYIELIEIANGRGL